MRLPLIAPPTSAPQVGASLYKMLVYEKGGFFGRHRDKVRIPHMFGTLVVTLPSAYSGAALHVQSLTNPEDVKTFEHFSSEPGRATRTKTAVAAAPEGVWWTAFYADCFHEVDELTDGSRIALVYNLTGVPISDPNGLRSAALFKFDPPRTLTAPPQPADETAVATIASAIKKWVNETVDDYPDKLAEDRAHAHYRWGGDVSHAKPHKFVAMLSHSYTPQSICDGLLALKGCDRLVGELLCAARYAPAGFTLRGF